MGSGWAAEKADSRIWLSACSKVSWWADLTLLLQPSPAWCWRVPFSTTPGGKVTLSTRSSGAGDDRALNLIPTVVTPPAVGEVVTTSCGHPGVKVQATEGSKARSKGGWASSFIGRLLDWCDVFLDLCGMCACVHVWCVGACM